MRSDKGSENVIVESLQQCLRYEHGDDFAGEKSFLTGKSTANQRIEANWGQLRHHMADFYINFFKKMEEINVLDTSNPIHIECLRYCLSGLIQQYLHLYRKEGNEHRIRRQNSRKKCGGKPNIRYYLPENFGAVDCKKSVNHDNIEIRFN